jgi:putative FmdB family regulatory protein
MPTYLYKCKTCGKEFEYQQNIKDSALTQCPDSICQQTQKGGGEVYRKIGNVGFVFNGSGFYLTDYVHKKEKFSDSSSKPKNGSTNTVSTSTTDTTSTSKDSNFKETPKAN